MVTRYAYSNGYHVERRFGWDTHGLPVEHQIDKNLNITSKEDVMNLGIDKYNAACREIVLKYAGEWQSIVEKMGRWIDFDNGYKTMDPTFMETVWWVFGQLWKKDMVYRGLRVMPYSTGCTTPLSNFEASDNYKDVDDPAVTVAFQLVDEPETSFLAWTTTPWTLPSNLSLCVNPDFEYVKVYDLTRERNFILLESLIGTLFKELSGGKKQDPKNLKYKVVGRFKGSDLKGWRYVPLFEYFSEQVSRSRDSACKWWRADEFRVMLQFEDRAYRVVCDSYVEATAGTGIVHQAPAFGEDDHRVAIANGIVAKDEMPPCPIDDAGRFTSEVPDFEGMHVKVSRCGDFEHIRSILMPFNLALTGRRQAHNEVPLGQRSTHRTEHPPTFLPLLLEVQHPLDLPSHPGLVRQGRGDQGQVGGQQREDEVVSGVCGMMSYGVHVD